VGGLYLIIAAIVFVIFLCADLYDNDPLLPFGRAVVRCVLVGLVWPLVRIPP